MYPICATKPIVYTNLQFADIMRRAESWVRGGVVTFAWAVRRLPPGIGLAINNYTDQEWRIPSTGVQYCKERLTEITRARLVKEGHPRREMPKLAYENGNLIYLENQGAKESGAT